MGERNEGRWGREGGRGWMEEEEYRRAGEGKGVKEREGRVRPGRA
jgi:hypothetical protein